MRKWSFFGALLALSVVAGAFAAPVVHLKSGAATLRIAVIGDVGVETTAIAAGLKATKPLDAIILVGDNIYPCGVKSATDSRWRILDPLSALGVPIYAVLGNHDYCGNQDAQINAPQPNWVLPAHQYTIRSDLADFAMLDTTPYALGVNRNADDEVREAFATSKATWRIAVGHHVIMSSGFHGIFPRKEVARMSKLLPVLRDQHVDLYLCGHDHHEELLDLGPPLVIVSGAGSDPVPMVTVRGQTIWPKSTHLREPIAFALLELTKTQLTVEFHNASGRRIAGPFRYAAKR